MRPIKLTIEYDGTDYNGWQAQRARPKTIQQAVEQALQIILKQKIRVMASGRTDAGVHARAQVAHFKTRSNIPLDRLQKGLNSLLPKDVVIRGAEETDADFHSRFDAKSKVYRYSLWNRNYRPALLRRYVHFCPFPLDLALMKRESQVLLGRHNFRSFQSAAGKERGSVRTIKRLKIVQREGLIHIDIEANGFLYNMVRNIVGTLYEIGRGRLPPGSMRRILLSRDRRQAGPTAPAKGLCLMEVKYGVKK